MSLEFFVGAITLAFSVLGLIGVGQEAFQLLWSASGIFYGLTYLVMFALPIADSRAPVWLKLGALSGFLTTFLFVVISILPIVQVDNRFLFAEKIGTVVLLANAIGAVRSTGSNHRTSSNRSMRRPLAPPQGEKQAVVAFHAGAAGD